MQYASDGDLLLYLNQHINNMTWEMKLAYLRDIASQLRDIHDKGLVHCNLHSGNIVFKNFQPFICGLDRSKSKSSESKSTVQGVSSFTAPEVFSTRKFTPESDIYAFGIIMYTMASGEPPFRNRASDSSLVCAIWVGWLQCPIPHQKNTRKLPRVVAMLILRNVRYARNFFHVFRNLWKRYVVVMGHSMPSLHDSGRVSTLIIIHMLSQLEIWFSCR